MGKIKIFTGIMDTLYVISRHIHEYESIPRHYGTEDEIFMVEVHTINLIGEYENLTMSEAAKISNKTISAMSQMIDKLIKKELIKKVKDTIDQRKVLLNLTDKGKIIYEYHKAFDEKQYSDIMKKMNNYSEEELKHYLKISLELKNAIQANTYELSNK